jgi:hypothetical protein
VLKPSEIVDEAVELRQVGAGLVWIPAANLVVTVGVLAVLVLARHQFYARVQRASLVKAVLTLGVGLAAGIALGYGLVSAFPGSLRPGDRLPYTVEKVLGDTIVIAYQGNGPSGRLGTPGSRLARRRGAAGRGAGPVSGRSAPPRSSIPATRRGSGRCWPRRASATRSATSPRAATRPRCSPPPGRRR